VRYLLLRCAAGVIALGAMAVSVAYLFLPAAIHDAASLLLALGMITIGGSALTNAVKRAFRFMTPYRAVRTLAGCLLLALREADFVHTEDSRFLVRRRAGTIECELEGGTSDERVLFAVSLREFLSPIEDPQYVLIKRAYGKRRGAGAYIHSYACPAALGESLNAGLLARRLSDAMGGMEAVNTRRPEGNEVLRRCRRLSYLNRRAVRAESVV